MSKNSNGANYGFKGDQWRAADILRSNTVATEIQSPLKTDFRIQKEMKTMGLFPYDRELLEYSRRDLAEDVTIEGRLITIHRTDDHFNDTSTEVSEYFKIRSRHPQWPD